MQQSNTISARCQNCNWESKSQNSHPNAKRHSKKYNHIVKVDWEFTYNPLV
jgi:hypothetical protein